MRLRASPSCPMVPNSVSVILVAPTEIHPFPAFQLSRSSKTSFARADEATKQMGIGTEGGDQSSVRQACQRVSVSACPHSRALPFPARGSRSLPSLTLGVPLPGFPAPPLPHSGIRYVLGYSAPLASARSRVSLPAFPHTSSLAGHTVSYQRLDDRQAQGNASLLTPASGIIPKHCM